MQQLQRIPPLSPFNVWLWKHRIVRLPLRSLLSFVQYHVSHTIHLSHSLWSRVLTAPAPSGESNLFRPDAKHAINATAFIEYGRIAIAVSPSGQATHQYDPNFVTVTDESVLISVKLVAPAALTLYAVHQTKIQSHETDFTTTLIPMQPNKQRSSPVSGGQASTPLPFKPLDFSCTELDISSFTGQFPPHTRHQQRLMLPRFACCYHYRIHWWYRQQVLRHAFLLPSARRPLQARTFSPRILRQHVERQRGTLCQLLQARPYATIQQFQFFRRFFRP